jgi:hypothetical protein
MTDIQILLIMAACVLAFGGYLVLCDRVRS